MMRKMFLLLKVNTNLFVFFSTFVLEPGHFTQWSSYSGCTVTCGGGIQVRTRSCAIKENSGKQCVGNKVDIRECNRDPCKGEKNL